MERRPWCISSATSATCGVFGCLTTPRPGLWLRWPSSSCGVRAGVPKRFRLLIHSTEVREVPSRRSRTGTRCPAPASRLRPTPRHLRRPARMSRQPFSMVQALAVPAPDCRPHPPVRPPVFRAVLPATECACTHGANHPARSLPSPRGDGLKPDGIFRCLRIALRAHHPEADRPVGHDPRHVAPADAVIPRQPAKFEELRLRMRQEAMSMLRR